MAINRRPASSSASRRRVPSFVVAQLIQRQRRAQKKATRKALEQSLQVMQWRSTVLVKLSNALEHLRTAGILNVMEGLLK